MVERRHGGVDPLEELWHPEQLTKDVAGKSLVGGMLLERVGSAALLYLPVASTPCMGGLLCAPSGEVGKRGNFCLFCVFLSFWRGGGGSKSHAHKATHKVRRRGCCGSTSLTTLHDAQMTVHT